jgi:hypothetical protein
VTRTPAGIAESETSLTAEVDMGSDLPLRLLLFEPMRDFARFWNDEQVGTLAYGAGHVCIFGRIVGTAACPARPLRAAAIAALTGSSGCRGVLLRD